MGSSWDEVRATLANKEEELDADGVKWVRLLDLFKAISPSKPHSNPGQKLVTYEGQLDLQTPDDYVRRRFPANQRGSNAIWLTWEAARKVYNYEVRR